MSKNIVIILLDKNGSIVFSDKEEYEQAYFDILIDANCYKELNENLNTSYKEKFMKEIQNQLHENLIT